MLDGEILLNLDTEEDDEIDIGCAGGVDVTATRTYNEEETLKVRWVIPLPWKAYKAVTREWIFIKD